MTTTCTCTTCTCTCHDMHMHMCMHMCMCACTCTLCVFACNFVTPSWGRKKEALRGGGSDCVRSVLLSGCESALLSDHCVLSGCRAAVSQAVTLGPDSDGTPRLSDSAVRLSDLCCQTVGESAVSAVGLSGTVRRCRSGVCCQAVRPGLRWRQIFSGVDPLERSLRCRVGACSRLRSCDRGGDSDFAPKAPRDRVGADWRLQNGAKRGWRSFCIVNESIAHLLEGLSPPLPRAPESRLERRWRWRSEI